jgi:iron complex outermembrane receptor protein
MSTEVKAAVTSKANFRREMLPCIGGARPSRYTLRQSAKHKNRWTSARHAPGCVVAVAMMWVICHGVTVAQTVAAPDSQQGGLAEIVVTAERRETRLQDTPIAVTALTSESIETNRIQSLQDVVFRAPSVNYLQPHLGEAYVSIRGTLVNTFGAGWDDAVTTFIDDVPMTGIGDNSPNLFDISGIEVLRGPQGTLFGRNVTGGAIVIHTLKPSFTPAYKAELTYGKDNLAEVRGLTTGPLVGNELAGKLAIDYRSRDPYVNNVTLGNKAGRERVGQARGQLLWQPSDEVSALLSADYLSNKSGNVIQLSGNMTSSLYPKLSYNPNDTNQGSNPNFDNTNGGIQARVDWTNSIASLTSISAFRHTDILAPNDTTGSPGNERLKYTTIKDQQFTEELHLASASERGLTWLVGLFYLHANKLSNEDVHWNPNPQSFFTIAVGQPLVPYQDIFYQRISLDSSAGFGELSVPVVDGVTFNVGGRYSVEKKTGTSILDTTIAPPPTVASYSHTWSAWTPKATVSWQPTANLLTYLTAAKGFKSGGYDTSASTSVGLARPFNPETVWSYELGEKFTGLEDHLILDVALFDARYSNMQTQQLNPLSGEYQTSNAASAEVKGIELESIVKATNWLTVGLNYAYDNARYTDYVLAGMPPSVYTDNQIPYVPKQTVHATMDTTFYVGAGRGTVDIGGDYTYRSPFYLNDSNQLLPFEHDLTAWNGLVNLHANWTSTDGRWQVSLWGKNVTDMRANTGGVNVKPFLVKPADWPIPNSAIYLATWSPGRVVGISLTARTR